RSSPEGERDNHWRAEGPTGSLSMGQDLPGVGVGTRLVARRVLGGSLAWGSPRKGDVRRAGAPPACSLPLRRRKGGGGGWMGGGGGGEGGGGGGGAPGGGRGGRGGGRGAGPPPPYPEALRAEAVALVRGSGRSIPVLAQELGASEQARRDRVKRRDRDRGGAG